MLGHLGRSPYLDAWRRVGPRYLRDLVLLVASYYAAAHVGYALDFAGPVAAVVWLPVGVGIAFLYLRGLGLWPGIVLGDLLVNNYSTLPVGSALGQSAGNVLEVVVATLLIRRLCPRDEPLATLRGVGGVAAAIATGTFVSAVIGSASSWLGHAITLGSLPYVWRTWWLGDLCGALIVLPLALSWSRPLRHPWPPGRVLEALLTLAAVVGLSVLMLNGNEITRSLAFPGLIWAALRFGPRGATVAITVVCGFAIWGTTHVLGPFGVGSIDNRLLEAQVFIATVSLSTLSVAALVREREHLARRLHASRTRLVTSSDEVRRRLERDLHDGAQQRLVALAAQLEAAATRPEQTPAENRSALAAAEAQVLLAIDDLREFSHGVHPSVLRRFGLAKAVADVAARSTIPIKVSGIPRLRLDQTTEATAYYVVVEAITNAQKYAHASLVKVRAHLKGDVLVLEVSDDGIGGGFERDGSGLQGLRDRVEATGGVFRVDSEAGAGTRVRAELPVAALA